MNKYEAMFIVRVDLSEEERKALYAQLAEVVTKNSGVVADANVWMDKRRLCYPIKKQHEGIYYLMNFSVAPTALTKMRYTYSLNEGIVRVLILNREE